MSGRYPLFHLLPNSPLEQHYAHYRFIENPIHDILLAMIEYISFYCPSNADVFLSVLRKARDVLSIPLSDSILYKIEYIFKAGNLDYFDNQMSQELKHLRDSSFNTKDKASKFRSIISYLMSLDAKAIFLNIQQTQEIFVQEIGISSLVDVNILSIRDNYYVLYPKIRAYGKIDFKQIINESMINLNHCLHQAKDSSQRCPTCNETLYELEVKKDHKNGISIDKKDEKNQICLPEIHGMNGNPIDKKDGNFECIVNQKEGKNGVPDHSNAIANHRRTFSYPSLQEKKEMTIENIQGVEIHGDLKHPKYEHKDPYDVPSVSIPINNQDPDDNRMSNIDTDSIDSFHRKKSWSNRYIKWFEKYFFYLFLLWIPLILLWVLCKIEEWCRPFSTAYRWLKKVYERIDRSILASFYCLVFCCPCVCMVKVTATSINFFHRSELNAYSKLN